MSFQFVDEWLDSTQHVITELSSDEIKQLVELHSLPLTANDQRIHYHNHDFPKLTPSTRQQEEIKHPKSGKTYLGESNVHNVSASRLKTATSGIANGVNNQTVPIHGTDNVLSSDHQYIIDVSLDEDISKLAISDFQEKDGSSAHSSSFGATPTAYAYSLPSTEDQEELEMEDEGGDSDAYSSSHSYSIILEEDPEYKLSPRPSSSFGTNRSTCAHPQLLNETDEAVTFYNDIRTMEDYTWLPRTFQNHCISLAQFQQQDGYHYMKNPRCPQSPPLELTGGTRSKSTYSYAESSQLDNFTHCHYLRTSLLNKRKVELLCRFCRGKNWVPKKSYDVHLALSHGILKLPNEELPFLLPYPQSMFKTQHGPYTNHSVECAQCNRWVLLGHSLDKPNASELKGQGLYFNYFAHFIKHHKDYVE